ncbi:MAG: hypothetical protein AAFN11_22975, partial [Chloroflexota bacterium]
LEAVYTASSLLSHLERANLFLVPLDEQRRWYRYHHLFRDLLRQRIGEHLSNQQIKSLHQRATRAFAERGLIDNSLTHSAAANEWNAVAEAIGQQGRHYLYNGETDRVWNWIEQLPDAVVLQHPRIALDKAWLLYTQLDLMQVSPYLECAGLKTDDLGHVSRTATLRAVVQITNGDVRKAIDYAESTLTTISDDYPAEKGGLYFLLGNGYELLNRIDDRGRAFEQAVNYLARGEDQVGYSGAVALLIRHHWTTGNLNAAHRLGEQVMVRFENDTRLRRINTSALTVYALVVFERHNEARFDYIDRNLTRALELSQLTVTQSTPDVWVLGTLALHKLA